jgi:hypothetical protein
MSNENFLQLPIASPAGYGDVIAAVQGTTNPQTVQMTLAQVMTLAVNTTVLHWNGDPNSFLPGTRWQLCVDTADSILYYCSEGGDASTAVWIPVGRGDVILPAQGGTGLVDPTANSILVANGSDPFVEIGPLTNGQLLVGSTGVPPVAATITGSNGITVTNGAGSIGISMSGARTNSWSVVTSGATTIATGQSYFANSGSQLDFLMNSSVGIVGSSFQICGINTGGWKITQGAGVQFKVGAASSTVGVAGSVEAAAGTDSASFVCVSSGVWAAVGEPLSAGLIIT